MKKYISNKLLLRILGIVLFVILWQLLSMIIGEDTFIFPSPITTLTQTVEMLESAYIYKCIAQTMIRMLIGFVISFAIAFILGVLAGNSEKFKLLIAPTMTVLKSLPTATLVYLFLVVVGARITPLMIVILVSFPILYENIVGGIESTPTALIESAKLDGANFISINFGVRIPLALPYIVVGIASTFALSLKIEIMAEVITGYTRLGLGSAILAAQRSDPTNMVPVFAYSLVTIVIVLLIDSISELIKTKFSKKYL